jgi:hypothetical protein
MSITNIKIGTEAEKLLSKELRKTIEEMLYRLCDCTLETGEKAHGIACGWQSGAKKGETVLMFVSSFTDESEAHVKLGLVSEILTMGAMDCFKIELARRVLSEINVEALTDEPQEAGDATVVH